GPVRPTPQPRNPRGPGRESSTDPPAALAGGPRRRRPRGGPRPPRRRGNQPGPRRVHLHALRLGRRRGRNRDLLDDGLADGPLCAVLPVSPLLSVGIA